VPGLSKSLKRKLEPVAHVTYYSLIPYFKLKGEAKSLNEYTRT